MRADEGRRRFTPGEGGMAQAGNQECLISRDTESRGLLERANQFPAHLFAG